MKDFFAWLFSQNNSDLQIGLFDIWHFLYLFIVLGGTAFLGFYMQNKSEKSKDTVIRLMAYLTVGLYVADFFIMPLSDSYDGISAYKLPFNICTVMAVLVPFAQFNKHWKRLKKTVVVLSIASPLMWMCYPGTALGGQPPFSYIIVQTFMYHGFLFAWGVLNLAYGRVKLDFKKIWQELCAILGMLVWAWFGNTVYDEGYNWFFIESSIFPFLTDEIMPPMVVFCVFGTCFLVYCAYYLVCAIVKRHNTKVQTIAVPSEKEHESEPVSVSR